MIVKHILVGSLIVRYIPVGLLEVPPQRINEKPPHYVGRNDLETLMASRNSEDWVKLRSVPGLDAHERNFLRFFISFVVGCSGYYSGKIQFERVAGCYVYFTLSLNCDIDCRNNAVHYRVLSFKDFSMRGSGSRRTCIAMYLKYVFLCSEMLLGPVPEGFQFVPKHKANAYS